MPMVPGPLAALTYGALKVGGYALFARGLNGATGRSVRELGFGFGKTAIGLAGGLAYLFAIVPATGLTDSPEWVVYAATLPIRVLSWTVALTLFYGWKRRPLLVLGAIPAGVAWSYALDAVMSVLFKVLPGMEMPFC